VIALFIQRDLYYQFIQNFESQNQLNETIYHVSCILWLPRHELGIVATPRGLVFGDVAMECDEERCRAVVPVSLMSDVRLLTLKCLTSVSNMKIFDVPKS